MGGWDLFNATLAALGLSATIWFGIQGAQALRSKMTKKRKIKQKQAQRGEGTLIESQQPAVQKQGLHGTGVQAQTLELEEEEPAP